MHLRPARGLAIAGLAILAISSITTAAQADSNSASASTIAPELQYLDRNHDGRLVYAALGDSFIASTGPLGPHLYDPSSGDCLRLLESYPAQIARDHGAEFYNLACAGAEVPDVLTRSRNGFNPQIWDLPADTDVAFLQIGGNDMGLTPTVLCMTLEPECTGESSAIRHAYDVINGAPGVPPLRDNIAELGWAIHGKAPDALVETIGYAQITPRDDQTAPIPHQGSMIDEYWLRCPWLTSARPGAIGERTLAYTLEADLNNAVRQGAERLPFARFVDVMTPESPFYGPGGEYLGACSGSPDRNMNNFEPTLAGFTAGNLHPNLKGVGAYKQATIADMAAAR